MNIAFSINKLAIFGLGVTISSLIRNCSNCEKLNIWFLCSGFSHKDKSCVIDLLEKESFGGNYHFIDFDPVFHFGMFHSLHGDWTTYGRLLLAELINEDRVLYLDSDLVVELDVLQVENFDFDGKALAAVFGCSLEYTLENKFFTSKLGLSSDLETFNAGVLLINLNEWRLKNIKNICLSIAKNYPLEILSNDQTLLNAVFAGNFAKLPKAFNCEWYSHSSKPCVSENMILHFVGSPKPWDPWGFLMHNGYQTYRKYLNKDWASSFNSYNFNIASFRRIWNIRRSYFKSIQIRFKK